MSYTLHTYTDINNEYRWGVVAENHSKLGHSGEGYQRSTDMFQVLEKMFVPVRGAFEAQHVPWDECSLHRSRSGRCFKHLLIDAKKLVQFSQEATVALGLDDAAQSDTTPPESSPST